MASICPGTLPTPSSPSLPLPRISWRELLCPQSHCFSLWFLPGAAHPWVTPYCSSAGLRGCSWAPPTRLTPAVSHELAIEKLRPAGSAAFALWDDDEHWRKVEGALDDARARFGNATITRARHVGRGDGRGAVRHPKDHGVD